MLKERGSIVQAAFWSSIKGGQGRSYYGGGSLLGEILGGMRLKPVGVRKLQAEEGGQRQERSWMVSTSGREWTGEMARKCSHWRSWEWSPRKACPLKGLRHWEKALLLLLWIFIFYTDACYGLSVCASQNSSGKILRPKVILSGGRAPQDWRQSPQWPLMRWESL